MPKSSRTTPGPSINGVVDNDAIARAIRKALLDVKAGNAYVNGELAEDDFEKIVRENADEGVMDKFFALVSTRLARQLNPTNKKKTTKAVLETINSQRAAWITEIQQCQDDDDTRMDTTPTNEDERDESDIDAKGAKTTTEDDGKPSASKATLSDMEVDDDPRRTTNMPAAAKPKPKSKTKKRKSRAMDNDGASAAKKKARSSASKSKTGSPKAAKKKKRALFRTKKKKLSTESMLEKMQAVREEAKKEFEEKKAEVLAGLPDDYKLLWGQVGYGKWQNNWLPCMFVGPYDVGPHTTMRDEWMKMFERTTKSNRPPTYLVFWYGQSDVNYSFSILPEKNVITYDKGLAKGYNKLSPTLRKKIEREKKLTKADRQLVAAHKELEEDLEKQPEERGNFDRIEELHENDDYIRVLAGIPKDSGDELISSDEDSEDDDDDDDDDGLASSSSELDSDSEDDGDAYRKLLSKKLKRTKKASKAAAPPEAVKDISFVEDEAAKAAAPPEAAEDFSFAEDEASSSDDSKDEDVVLSDASGDDEDDEDYADYKVDQKPAKKRKRVDSSKEKKPQGRVKQKRSETTKKEPKQLSERALKAQQTKEFQRNEDTFLPMLELLKAAIAIRDPSDIQRTLSEILEKVGSMGAPFMEEYKVSPLMKDAKKILKEERADMSTYKSLFSRMGELYKEKKVLVPSGYVPKKRKDIEAKVAKKKKAAEMKAVKDAGKSEERDLESTKPPPVDRLERARTVSGSKAAAEIPSTPVRRVSSQGSSTPRPRVKPSPTALQPDLSLGSKSTTQKLEKASFSLNRLINKPMSLQQSKSDDDSHTENQATQGVPVNRGPPSWMTTAPPDEVGSLTSEKVDRLLALDFFNEMACCFPDEKVKRDAISRSLEAALYQWSQEQYKKEDTYWTKLHAVVAGICGKTKPGSLVSSMMAGDYKTARDIIDLSDDILHHSFEGI